jgi:predicted metalloprotease
MPYTPVEIDYLLHNKLYAAGQVAAVPCSFPTAKLATKQALIRYATAVVRCLDRAWSPVIRRADFGFVPPVAVHAAPTGSSDAACGAMAADVLAFYCATNLGIYFNWPEYVVKDSSGQEQDRAAVQYLMAHEYGHHVQWMTGMANDYGTRYGAASSAAARQREEDRNEMQAHCFAAAFFGANQETLELHGDQLEHYGHPGFRRSEVGNNFARWLQQAFEARGPKACNTWAVPYQEIKGV